MNSRTQLRYRFSLANLLCIAAASAMIFAIFLLRKELNSTSSQLSLCYKEFAGFENMKHVPQFNVVSVGGSVSNAEREEFCGAFLITNSDFRQFQLCVESFDGKTSKLTSAVVPMLGPQVSLTILTEFSDNKAVNRLLRFHRTNNGQFIFDFPVRYSSDFHYSLRESNGKVHKDAILAIAFLDGKGKHEFHRFPYSRVSDLSIDRLQELATEEKITVVYFRLNKAIYNEDIEKKVATTHGRLPGF